MGVGLPGDNYINMEVYNTKYLKEDIEYLDDWVTKAVQKANNIHAKAQSKGLISIFTISTTAKSTNKHLPYLTPTRSIIHGFIGGAVVFSQTQAILLSKHIPYECILARLINSHFRIPWSLARICRVFGVRPKF